MIRNRALAWIACFAGLGAGCSHYQLGTEGRLAFSTLYVEPVANRARIPQVRAPVTDQIRSAFEKDGRVSLVDSRDAADAVLTVVLVDYHREIASVREQDTGLASKFKVTLTATCTLRDTRTGKAYFTDRGVAATRDVFTDNGQPTYPLVGNQLQAEYDAVPLLAEVLADKVSHTVLDVW